MDSVLLSNLSNLSLNSEQTRTLFIVTLVVYNLMSMDGGESSRVSKDYLVEVENDDLNHIPPINSEAFFRNPDLQAFLMEPICGLVDSCSRMLYFDGAGSYAIPHAQIASQNIVGILEILECWLVEKLFHNHELMPILEECPQNATNGIMSKLREGSFVLNGLSKVLISIRVGHVYSLHMIGDEIVMPQSHESFAKRFPLFVNVYVNVQKSPCVTTRHNSYSHNTCKVLVVSERTTPSLSTITKRVASSADGKIFYQLEEVATSVNVTGNAAN